MVLRDPDILIVESQKGPNADAVPAGEPRAKDAVLDVSGDSRDRLGKAVSSGPGGYVVEAIDRLGEFAEK